MLEYKIHRSVVNYNSGLVGGSSKETLLGTGKASIDQIKTMLAMLQASSRLSKSKIDRECTTFHATTIKANGQKGVTYYSFDL